MQDKIIIFDWGGVILNEYPDLNNSKDAIFRIMKKYNNEISNDEAYNIYLETLLDENGINISTQNDIDSKQKWVNRISEKLKTKIEYEDFINTFSNEYKKISYYKEVVNYIYSLKGKCKIGLLSNILFSCYDALKEQIDLSKFDFVWLSFEINCRKPDERIFQIVESETKVLSKDILFIDDKMRNLNVAKARGWNTCCATGNEIEKIKNDVEKFLNI